MPEAVCLAGELKRAVTVVTASREFAGPQTAPELCPRGG